MPLIQIKTLIQAPLPRCFDLCRSIDLHKLSLEGSGEEAVAGTVAGLIGPGEWVTWQARHFGIRQKLTVAITDFEPPYFFADEMLRGAFRSFRHEHWFEKRGEEVLMTDFFDYSAPFGLLGRLADRIVLEKYMEVLLRNRNAVIKSFAESERWREVLP